MLVTVDMRNRPDPFYPKRYEVTAVEKVSPDLLFSIMREPMKDRTCIAEHIEDMGYNEKNGQYGALVLYDGGQDALIIHSSGYSYCRYAGYAPKFMVVIEQEIRMAVQEMVAQEVTAFAQTQDGAKPHKPFITWDDLGKRLGFAVSPESGLRDTVKEAMGALVEVRSVSVTKNGIKFDTDISELCIDAQDQQMGGIQL